MNGLERWAQEALDVLRLATGSPEPPAQTWILLGVGVLVALLFMKLVSLATGNVNSTIVLNLLVILLGGALVLAGAVAARLYVGPRLPDPRYLPALTAAGAGAAFLLLAVPAMCVVQRVKFLVGLVTWIASVMAAVLVALLLRSLLGGVRGAESQFETSGERREAAERIFKP